MCINEKEIFEGFLSMSKAFFDKCKGKEARTKPTYLLKSSSCTFIYAVSSPTAPKVIIQKSHSREVSPLEDTIDCEYLDYFEANKRK